MHALFLLLTLAFQVHGELWSISTVPPPYLSLLDPPGHFIHWNNGFVAQKLATSQAVRLNERGIQFIPLSYTTVPIVNEWAEFNCDLSPKCMCELKDTRNVTSRVFPGEDQEVFSLIGNMADFETKDIQELLRGKCQESKTGRITSDDSRDISLCDITSGKVDIVFFPWKHKMYISSFQIPVLTIVIVSIVTIYVATILAKNVDRLINTSTRPLEQGLMKSSGLPMVASSGGEEDGSLLSPIAIFVALMFTIFPDTQSSPLHMFVTSTDRFAFLALIIYYILYNIIHFFSQKAQYSPIAPMICILTLFSMRAFGTLDNPYISTLTAIFVARFVTKLYDNCLFFEVISQHLIDSAILCVFLFIGILPQFDFMSENVLIYVIQCVVVGMTIANLIKREG